MEFESQKREAPVCLGHTSSSEFNILERVISGAASHWYGWEDIWGAVCQHDPHPEAAPSRLVQAQE